MYYNTRKQTDKQTKTFIQRTYVAVNNKSFAKWGQRSAHSLKYDLFKSYKMTV